MKVAVHGRIRELRDREDPELARRYRLAGVSNFSMKAANGGAKAGLSDDSSVGSRRPCRLLSHHLLHPFFHFFGSRLRLVCPDHPSIALWINDRATTITPEHVHHGALCGGAQLGRFLNNSVDVLDVYVEAGGRGADTL